MRRSVLSFVAVLGAAACGSSPEPVYYSLSVAQQETRPASAGRSWAHLIKLRRPALPGYLDRAEIVTRVSGFRLRVASGESWSEPLGDMVGRVLADDLSRRLGDVVVFTEASPISSDPDAIVSVDIQRFDIGDDGAMTLRAEIAVERVAGHALVTARHVELHARPSASSTAALAGAMSELLAGLAGEVSSYLVAPVGP